MKTELLIKFGERIKTLRKELDPIKLVQEIFELEKKENPEIF